MVQAWCYTSQIGTTDVVAPSVALLSGVSCTTPRPSTAKPRRNFPLFGRGSAQICSAELLTLKSLFLKALTGAKAMSQQQGTDQCRQANSSPLLGSAQAWQPVATPPVNRWRLAPEQGPLARFCLTAIRLLAQPLAWLQTSSTARKNPETASQPSGVTQPIRWPVVAALHIALAPHPANGPDAVFCVPTSRRQRTAHV